MGMASRCSTSTLRVRRRRAPAGRRDHAPAHDGLDGRLAPPACVGSSRRWRSRSASPSRCTRRTATRPSFMLVNDRYLLEDVVAEGRRYAALRGRKVFVEYVMLVRRERHGGAGARPGGAARSEGVQGQPHPLQPHRAVRGLVARSDRVAFRKTLVAGCAGDRAPDARTRHRSRVRPTSSGAAAADRGCSQGQPGLTIAPHSRASRQQGGHAREVASVGSAVPGVASGRWGGAARRERLSRS